MYMQDANCIWVETGPYHTIVLWGEIATITFKTQICKLALQISPPPLLLASQELVLQRQS